jgi:tetratricopeptide (TPR) repeat protein
VLSFPQVQQYRQAVQAIIQGDTAAATPLLLQLLNEPLLQPAAQDASSGAATAAAGGGSSSAAQRKAQQQQQQVLQSRNLQGMRPKVLLSLAPLLGQTQKALEIWAEALTYDPNNAKVWEELSIVLAHLGHLRLAVQAADRAVGLRSSDVSLLERLAVLLAAQQVSDCHV